MIHVNRSRVPIPASLDGLDSPGGKEAVKAAQFFYNRFRAAAI